MYLIRIIHCWYFEQNVCIRWNDSVTSFFGVSNGIRQGSILSPCLFNIYFDDLSRSLNKIYAGCYFNSIIVNHLLYADDIVLLCPSLRGLQSLIDVCAKFGELNDVTFNEKKTVCMVLKSKESKNFAYSEPFLNECKLSYVNKYKYLGLVINSDFNDKDDISRQICNVYARGNSLVRNFDMCSDEVKIRLFNTYVTNVYGCHLWGDNQSRYIHNFCVSYHNVFRRFFHLPRHINGVTCSVSEALASRNIPCVGEIISRLAESLAVRLNKSENAQIICVCPFCIYCI